MNRNAKAIIENMAEHQKLFQQLIELGFVKINGQKIRLSTNIIETPSVKISLSTKHPQIVKECTEFVKLLELGPWRENYREIIYCIKNDVKEIPKCQNDNCDNRVGFAGDRVGHLEFCCNKCVSSSSIIKQKKEKTFLDRYGSTTFYNSEENKRRMGLAAKNRTAKDRKKIQDKREKTNLKKFGFKSHNANPDIQKKTRKTMKEKYGVEHGFQSKEIYAKMKRTMIERHGVSNPLESEKIKLKIRKTNMKKYGGPAPYSDPAIRNKGEETNLKRTGYRYNTQNPDFVAKCKRRFHEKTGLYYDSLAEMRFIDSWIAENPIESIKRGPSLPYQFDKERHVLVDFELIYKDGSKKLLEIKATHGYFWKELNSGKLYAKCDAIQKYADENGYVFEIAFFGRETIDKVYSLKECKKKYQPRN